MKKTSFKNLKNGDIFYFSKGSNREPFIFDDCETSCSQAKKLIKECNFIKRNNKVIYQKKTLFKLEKIKQDDTIVTFDNMYIPVMYIADIYKYQHDIAKIIRKGKVIAKRKNYKFSLLYNPRYHV